MLSLGEHSKTKFDCTSHVLMVALTKDCHKCQVPWCISDKLVCLLIHCITVVHHLPSRKQHYSCVLPDIETTTNSHFHYKTICLLFSLLIYRYVRFGFENFENSLHSQSNNDATFNIVHELETCLETDFCMYFEASYCLSQFSCLLIPYMKDV